MPKNEMVTIDVDDVIASKAKGKKFPRFVVNFIKKLIHQDFLNEYFRRGDLGVDFADGALKYLGDEFEVIGADNIPSEGRFTFAANHPLGGADALQLISYVCHYADGKLYTPANDFLMNLKQLSEFLIPVNKMGGQSRDLAALLDEAFNSDRQIAIFPAGLCSRKIDGIIQDLPWKKTFVTKSRSSGRDIIPVWFSGRNSNRFYFVDKLCKKLKLKTNFAMFFLPDELYRNRNKKFKMVIGKPIPVSTFTPEKKDAEWAAYVREKVYELDNEK